MRREGHKETPRPDFIKALGEFWELPPEVKSKLLGKRKKQRETRFQTLLDIRVKLGNLFRSKESENSWLRTPVSELKGKSPLDLLNNGSMKSLKLLKEYVYFLCFPSTEPEA